MALVEALDTPHPHTFSYDTRKRDTPMETSLDGAATALKETVSLLEERVRNVPLDMPLTLHAITPFKQAVQTTFGREVHTLSYRCSPDS